MIVNNSTNINKTNNHVHPVILYLKSLNTIITRHTKLEIQVLASDRQNNVAWINRLMGSQLNLQCQYIYMYKQTRETNKQKPAQIRFHPKRPHTIFILFYSIFFSFFLFSDTPSVPPRKKRKKNNKHLNLIRLTTLINDTIIHYLRNI